MEKVRRFLSQKNDGLMTSLQGKHVFVSSSFPSGTTPGELKHYDASATIDAVVAISRAVLLCEGRFALGGHPTITPVVLAVAKAAGVKQAVDVFLSRWFDDRITEETRDLAESGVGSIHFVDRGETKDESLLAMRLRLLLELRPVAAMFVGGKSGVVEEHMLVKRHLPEAIRLPFGGPGGAAATLPRNDVERLAEDPKLLEAREYPFLAHVLVKAIGRTIARTKAADTTHAH